MKGKTLNNKFSFIILLMALVLIISGCGGEEYYDDRGDSYQITMVTQDAGQDTLDIDTVKIKDCDGNPITNDAEYFTNGFGIVTIKSFENVPTVKITKYTVEYIPNFSPAGTGGYVMPPQLQSYPVLVDIFVPTNEIVSFTIFAVPLHIKEVYELEKKYPLKYGLYTIKVNFFGEDESGNSVRLAVNKDVDLGPFDNCP